MKRSISFIVILMTLSGICIGRWYNIQSTHKNSTPTNNDPTPTPIVAPQAPTLSYTLTTLVSDTPLKELTTLIGPANMTTVLKLNRIDAKFLTKGSTLVIPSTYDWDALSPFPTTLDVAHEVPKLLLFSQQIQAFGVYEYGHLVRWGPISSGKASTPTPQGLYFTNWKSEWIRSTENYDWILKWNFNLDNIRGIGMHEYELPGYPASHSCIRMTEDDAKWLYNWADQWVVSRNGEKVLKHGTPVIVFGEYAFEKSAPWKDLVENIRPTVLSTEDLEEINQYLTADKELLE